MEKVAEHGPAGGHPSASGYAALIDRRQVDFTTRSRTAAKSWQRRAAIRRMISR